jgi:hypothetical protein
MPCICQPLATAAVLADKEEVPGSSPGSPIGLPRRTVFHPSAPDTPGRPQTQAAPTYPAVQAPAGIPAQRTGIWLITREVWKPAQRDQLAATAGRGGRDAAGMVRPPAAGRTHHTSAHRYGVPAARAK